MGMILGEKQINEAEAFVAYITKKFIKDEVARPVRLLTTTIKINSVEHDRLPVRSDIPIPKENMLEMIREVKKINISVPVKAGQVIADNFMGLGIIFIIISFILLFICCIYDLMYIDLIVCYIFLECVLLLFVLLNCVFFYIFWDIRFLVFSI